MEEERPPSQLPVAPKTTTEQDVRTAAQRRLNFIWEMMQALIAAVVVGMAVFVTAKIALLVLIPDASERQIAMANTAFVLMSNLVSLVIGFYFGRTNHARMGDPGTGGTNALDDRKL